MIPWVLTLCLLFYCEDFWLLNIFHSRHPLVLHFLRLDLIHLHHLFALSLYFPLSHGWLASLLYHLLLNLLCCLELLSLRRLALHLIGSAWPLLLLLHHFPRFLVQLGRKARADFRKNSLDILAPFILDLFHSVFNPSEVGSQFLGDFVDLWLKSGFLLEIFRFKLLKHGPLLHLLFPTLVKVLNIKRSTWVANLMESNVYVFCLFFFTNEL